MAIKYIYTVFFPTICVLFVFFTICGTIFSESFPIQTTSDTFLDTSTRIPFLTPLEPLSPNVSTIPINPAVNEKLAQTPINSSTYYVIKQAYWGPNNFQEYSFQDNNTFNVLLQYSGSAILHANASLTLTSPDTSTQYGRWSLTNSTIAQTKTTLNPDTTTLIIFTYIEIFPQARTGTYNLSFGIDFLYLTSNWHWETSIPVSLTDTTYPDFVINTNNQTKLRYSTQVVEFVITNIGIIPATRMEFQLFSLTNTLNVLGNSRYTTDWLYQTHSWIIDTNISIIQPVPSTMITMVLNYWDQFNHHGNITQQIGYEVDLNTHKSLLLANIVNNPFALYPGDQGVIISSVLANDGNESLSYLNITLQIQNVTGINPSYPGSTNMSYGTMLPGTTITATFIIDISNDIEGNKLHYMLLECVASNYTKMFNISIYINEKADFAITRFITTPSILHRGDRSINILVEFRNRGAEANNVRVRLINAFFSGTVTAYSLTLESNQLGYAVFDVDLNNQAPLGEVSIELQFSWSQGTREFTQSQWSAVSIVENIDLLPWIVLGGLLVGSSSFVIYHFYKKRQTSFEKEA